eukprot:3201640-Pleurochrysis_carterae.AAC.1
MLRWVDADASTETKDYIRSLQKRNQLHPRGGKAQQIDASAPTHGSFGHAQYVTPVAAVPRNLPSEWQGQRQNAIEATHTKGGFSLSPRLSPCPVKACEKLCTASRQRTQHLVFKPTHYLHQSVDLPNVRVARF